MLINTTSKLKSNIANIIKPDFGSIREVYFNRTVEAFLFETDFGFQFIFKDDKIIQDNVSHQFKIIGNTFPSQEVTFLTQYGLHKSKIENLIVKTTTDIWWVRIQYYDHPSYQKLNFPFFQYFNAHLKSFDKNNKLLLVDDYKGIVCYNVSAEEVEFHFEVFQKTVSTIFSNSHQNEIYWNSIDKFEISKDEKYFYVITAYEGKSLFVFRTEDYSLLYHEIGSYALSFAVFYNDQLIVPAGYDYDADDKQPFKIVNLKNGSVVEINKTSGTIQDFHCGAIYKNLCVTYNQVSNSEVYNNNRYFLAIRIDDLINSKTITGKEISIEPEFNLENILLKDIFIQDNYLTALTWNNTVSLHSITEKEENNMDELINSIFSKLEDYRADEGNPFVQITTDRIRLWINQFDEDLRFPILTELDNIFEKRYLSRNKIKLVLEAIVLKLSEEFNFSTPQDFLQNADFLDFQPEGKSQKVMLRLFDEIIREKFGLSIADCGTVSKLYSIYIDDILCTGLTLISDVQEWCEKNFELNKTNGEAVADNSTTLVFAYVFIHEKNYQKKKAEMRHKISKDVSSKHKMYRLIDIENSTDQNSKIDLIYPLENGQPQSVIDYKSEIIELVDNHNQQYKMKSAEEFYRPTGLPKVEQFFTSAQNRIIVENAFLQKGIEILHNANANNRNIRALGYSIPSVKNFGFGALCFSWRNVPNNAPLVFWYSGGGFLPLFVVTRGTNPTITLTL